MNTIGIAAALIRRGNKVLAAKRPPHKAYPGRWEFPGGKIEAGESPEACLVREIKEEFGITVRIKEPCHVWEYEYVDPVRKRFRLYGYWCEVAEGEPQLFEHEEFRWLGAHELEAVDLLEADREIIPMIRKKLNEKDSS